MIHRANRSFIVGEVGDEFSEEHLAAKVTDLCFFLTKKKSLFFWQRTSLYQTLDIAHGSKIQTKTIPVEDQSDSNDTASKMVLPWPLKKLSILLPFVYINKYIYTHIHM